MIVRTEKCYKINFKLKYLRIAEKRLISYPNIVRIIPAPGPGALKSFDARVFKKMR